MHVARFMALWWGLMLWLHATPGTPVSGVSSAWAAPAPLLPPPVVLLPSVQAHRLEPGMPVPLTGWEQVLGDPLGAMQRRTEAVISQFGAATSAPRDFIARGLASWYGPRFHGRRTASGERYDMHDLTAAHKTLPFGTRLRVRSVHTGKEVVVRVTDRGPYKHQRVIDLSWAAAMALDVAHRGVTAVELFQD